MFRRLWFLLLFGIFLLPQAVPASAAETATGPGIEARKALEARVGSILAVLRDPGFADKASRAQYRMKIEAEVAEIFDFDEFSSRTVGTRWPQFTPEQRRNFTDAFAALLKATYLDRIDDYSGEQIAYVGETISAKGDRVEVRTTLRMKDGKIIPVSYRMLPKAAKWVVYDVVIENISLVMNYRTQFEDLLLRSSPEALIARVLEKAQKIRESIDAQ